MGHNYNYGHLIFDNVRRLYIQQIVLGKLEVSMQKKVNRFIIITLNKTQDQIDERLQHKTIYTERDRREKEQPSTHWPRRSEQHTNSKPVRPTLSNWNPMKLFGARRYFAGYQKRNMDINTAKTFNLRSVLPALRSGTVVVQNLRSRPVNV